MSKSGRSFFLNLETDEVAVPARVHIDARNVTWRRVSSTTVWSEKVTC